MHPGRGRSGETGIARLTTNGGTETSRVDVAVRDDMLDVRLAGRCTIDQAESLAARLGGVHPARSSVARIDLSAVTALDTAGAWVLFRFIHRLEGICARVDLAGEAPAQAALLQRMRPVLNERKPLARPAIWPIRAMVERVGRAVFTFLDSARSLISFFGLVTTVVVRTLTRPDRVRFISLLSHVERIGLDAMPIVGLLSFLIGVVLAFQGADQLRAYGAEIFTINLLGVSVLRELGVLLTAIMVAGRSGSAFTAEIGTMKVNEEVDALMTLGLDPVEVLVLPRLAAMMIALPLLVFFADMMALLGGAAMSILVLEISLEQFIVQFREAITDRMFWVGIAKAPVFAILIAMVGCYEGLRVEGSAESVGRLTTKAVVESIFLVIVADAAFSVFFSYIGV